MKNRLSKILSAILAIGRKYYNLFKPIATIVGIVAGIFTIIGVIYAICILPKDRKIETLENQLSEISRFLKHGNIDTLEVGITDVIAIDNGKALLNIDGIGWHSEHNSKWNWIQLRLIYGDKMDQQKGIIFNYGDYS